MQHITDSDLVVRFISKSSTINKERTDYQEVKQAKDMFSGDIQAGDNPSSLLHLKLFREIQIKIIMACQVILAGWQKLKPGITRYW